MKESESSNADPGKDDPVVPPSGSIPPIHTSESLESAVMISAFVIAVMIGFYVSVTIAWAWLTVCFLLALADLLDKGKLVPDILWSSRAVSVALVLIFLIKPLPPLCRRG